MPGSTRRRSSMRERLRLRAGSERQRVGVGRRYAGRLGIGRTEGKSYDTAVKVQFPAGVTDRCDRRGVARLGFAVDSRVRARSGARRRRHVRQRKVGNRLTIEGARHAEAGQCRRLAGCPGVLANGTQRAERQAGPARARWPRDGNVVGLPAHRRSDVVEVAAVGASLAGAPASGTVFGGAATPTAGCASGIRRKAVHAHRIRLPGGARSLAPAADRHLRRAHDDAGGRRPLRRWRRRIGSVGRWARTDIRSRRCERVAHPQGSSRWWRPAKRRSLSSSGEIYTGARAQRQGRETAGGCLALAAPRRQRHGGNLLHRVEHRGPRVGERTSFH